MGWTSGFLLSTDAVEITCKSSCHAHIAFVAGYGASTLR